MRPLLVVARLVIVVTLVAPDAVRADKGELALGPHAALFYPVAGRVGGAARLGLTDWISVEGRLGIGYDRTRVSSNASAGLVLAWDVLTWVPELAFAAGVSLPHGGSGRCEPRFGADIGIRHYFGPRSSFGIAAGTEWGPLVGWTVALRLTVWRALL